MSAHRVSSLSLFAILACAPLTAGDRLFVSGGVNTILRYDLPSDVPTTVVEAVSGSGTCSADGYIYFLQSSPSSIHRWDQDGGSRAFALWPFQGPSEPHPSGLTFDAAGDLYINSFFGGANDGAGAWRLAGGDPANVPELVVPPFGRFGGEADTIAGGPHAGALLFAVDDRVVISEPPGAPAEVFIAASNFPFGTTAIGLASNPCGEVFVGRCTLNGGGCWVERFDPEGQFLETLAGPFWDTFSLAFDSAGNLYNSDPTGRTLWKLAPDGSLAAFARYSIGPLGIVMCLEPLACGAGGPYRAECTGETTCLALRAEVPDRPCGSYLWTSDCPGADFAGSETSPSATLCLMSDGCTTTCGVSFRFEEGLRSATCSAEVIVEDTTAPALVGVPADEIAECDAVPPPAEPVAEDACDPSPSVRFEERRADGRCPDEYTLTRTWTASDRCGNAASQAQVVTVVDTTVPVVTALLEPAEPALPRPAASPGSVCSPPASGSFHVRCSAEDSCDPAPETSARLVVTNHDVPQRDGPCIARREEIDVDCDELVELRLVAPPCPAKPPRSPRPSLSVTSLGVKVVSAESVVLRVRGVDRCGNEREAAYDPSREPSPACTEVLEDGTCCPAIARPAGERCRMTPCGGG